jgi:hypothetical protein
MVWQEVAKLQEAYSNLVITFFIVHQIDAIYFFFLLLKDIMLSCKLKIAVFLASPITFNLHLGVECFSAIIAFKVENSQ